jgi:FdrA protein
MSATATRVIANRYFDSVFLMRVAKRLGESSDVEDAAVVMGTDANKALLHASGFDGIDLTGAGANDLVAAVKARTSEAATAALAGVDEMLVAHHETSEPHEPATIDEAVAKLPGANLAVISVPGQYAAAQARAALERGLHVHVFSSNVSVEDEVALKRLGSERGLLVMGPDAGTSIIGGAGIGFANAVRRGPIGVVGPSGTGIQAITTFVHRMGSGISQAIGTGSHDLADGVEGLSTFAGLRALEQDPETQVVVIVGKTAGDRTLIRLQQAAWHSEKPVVICLLGSRSTRFHTLEQTAREAVESLPGVHPGPLEMGFDWLDRLDLERDSLRPGQRVISGLFAGGTFCAEAQRILVEQGLAVRSNAPIEGAISMDGASDGPIHRFLDMGAEEYTQGRPHPMLDARARRERLLAEAEDPDVAVCLLDVVLGYGAAADPAGDLAEAIEESRAVADARGWSLTVLASVCGTEEDPQDLEHQQKTLLSAGAVVLPTSACAVRAAVDLVERQT